MLSGNRAIVKQPIALAKLNTLYSDHRNINDGLLETVRFTKQDVDRQIAASADVRFAVCERAVLSRMSD